MKIGKSYLLFALCLVFLLGLGVSATADIPSDVDYHAVYNRTDFTWSTLRDVYGYGFPAWEIEYLRVYIPNLEMPAWYKDVWVESIYEGGVPGTFQPFDTNSIVPYMGFPTFFEQTVRYEGTKTYKTWHWRLSEQCSYEYLVFQNITWFNKWYLYQEPYLTKIEIGTKCTVIPEPSSLLALAGMLSATGGLLLRRRK